MMKIVALASLCFLCTPVIHAQTDNTPTNSAAAKLQKKWFDYDPTEIRHRFTIELNKGESVTLNLVKLEDWKSTSEFMTMMNSMDRVMRAYKDSVGQDQSTLTLDVSIPVNQKNMITRLKRTNEYGNLMTINSDGASSLKLGMDTLRVLQHIPSRVSAKSQIWEDEGTLWVQYVFVLKELSNYEDYARDNVWKEKAARKIDSLVRDYITRKRHNNRSNGVVARYNPETDTLRSYRGGGIRGTGLNIDAGFGVSLVRNTICPNLDYGIGIYLARDNNDAFFTRVSFSSFYRFVETTPDKYKVYGTMFVNAEIGGESNHRNPKSLFYKSSLGFGYKLINKKADERDPTMDKQMYRLFFNYSINKFFVFTPEIIGNFRKGDRYNGWIGLSVNFRIL